MINRINHAAKSARRGPGYPACQKWGVVIDPAPAKITGPGQGKGSEGMERPERLQLVEDALEALKPRYQRTRTPFNLQTIREEVEAPRCPAVRR